MSKQISCDLCPMTFGNRSGLFYHKQAHKGVKKYTCQQCDKVFSKSSHLKTHFLIHTEEKFSCDVCLKTFAYRSNLSQHKKIHSGVKKYSCPQCNKSFVLNHHEEALNHSH